MVGVIRSDRHIKRRGDTLRAMQKKRQGRRRGYMYVGREAGIHVRRTGGKETEASVETRRDWHIERQRRR